ncbi:partitioning protein, partial [Escherichia coli]
RLAAWADDELAVVQNRVEQNAPQPVPTTQITSQMAGNIRALFPE